MKKSVFSLPINPKLDKQFTDGIFIPWLTKYKPYIKDLYFTCRMPPFTQDAMGDTFAGDLSQLVFNALVISRETEIPISATFNNIYVRPDQEGLDLFIHNFKQIYSFIILDRYTKIIMFVLLRYHILHGCHLVKYSQHFLT